MRAYVEQKISYTDKFKLIQRLYVVKKGLMWSYKILCDKKRAYVVKKGIMWSKGGLCREADIFWAYIMYLDKLWAYIKLIR